MKKRIITNVLAMFAFAVCIQAQQPYTCTTPGMQMEYQNFDGKGTLIGYSESKVVSVNGSSDKLTVIQQTSIFDAKHTPRVSPFKTEIRIENGAIYTKPSFPPIEKATVSIDNFIMTYPKTLAVGQKLERSAVNMKMTVEGITLDGTMIMRDGIVEAHESVTVAAGTFDCYKVSQITEMKFLGKSTIVKSETWVSAGIGSVKTLSYDDNGKLQSRTELTKIKKP